MQLTPPQPPQDDEIKELRIGLSGYNKDHAGTHLREPAFERCEAIKS